MEVMSASVAAVVRSSGGATRAVFTVGGGSGWSWLQLPNDTAALARVRLASLYDPFTLNEYAELVGHHAAWPTEGPALMSVARSGLSNLISGKLFSYHDPS